MLIVIRVAVTGKAQKKIKIKTKKMRTDTHEMCNRSQNSLLSYQNSTKFSDFLVESIKFSQKFFNLFKIFQI